MKNIDEATISLLEYKKNIHYYIEQDLSESDTRSKLIDFILIEILGWKEEDILREGHVESGYYDYKISIPGIHFIVEAKRKFKELLLPSNHKQASIKSLIAGNKEVIEQLRNYCIDESIQYGIITNGSQFLILKAFNTDNRPWKENICLIFNGVDDLEKRFVEFYENLSKHAVINNGGFRFDLPSATIASKTVLSTLIDKDKYLIRNSLSASITPIIDKIFGEIFSEEREDDDDFIKYCFIENQETKKNKSEIERLFGDYAPKIGRIIPAVNSKNIAEQICDEINEDEVSLKNSFPPKPIVIIGSKGAGKTTFINHLFKYRFNPSDIEHHFPIYIEFRKFFESNDSLDPLKICQDILDRIYDKYEDLELHSLRVLKRIYITDIKRNDESIWLYDRSNDEASYNKRLSEFLERSKQDSIRHFELLSKYLIRERRKRLVIIIDNADQFNDEVQKDLFIFAHSLTKGALCGTVISLREGYYYKWQNSPPFDAYESNVYHITAPSYVEILQKRIDYALEKAPNMEKKIKGANQRGYKVEFSPDYITHFLSGLKSSILSVDNKLIVDFLNHTTYPNIREGLKVFKSFLISGHTKVSDYILREKFRKEEGRQERSIIPIHEFIKSIGLQNRLYYNSAQSTIFNIFLPPLDTVDHFLNIYLLQELSEFIEKKSYTEKFVESTVLIEKFNALGYKINSITSALANLITYSLVDTDEQQSDIKWNELPSSFNICLTGKGHYYLNEMTRRFYYFDLVLQDTPVFDLEHFELIRSSFPLAGEDGSRNLVLRVQTCDYFLNYLKIMEDKQPSQIKQVYGSVMESIRFRVLNELSYIYGVKN